MTPRKKMFFSVTFATGLWSGVVFAGPISVMIDDFSADQAQAVTGGDGSTFSPGAGTTRIHPGTQISDSDGGLLGGRRDLFIASTGGATGVFGDRTGTRVLIGPAATGTGQEVMKVSNDDGVTGTVVLTWDGSHAVTADPTDDANVDTDGLGGVDFLAAPEATPLNSGILLQVLSIDLSGVIASLDIWDLDGTKATAMQSLGPTATDYLTLFTDFSIVGGTGGMDWNQVGAVRMTLTGPAGWDGSFGLVAVDPVPEPMSLTLFGAGLALLGVWRRNPA